MDRLIVGGIDLDLLDIPYSTSRHPGNVSVGEFLEKPHLGANCELTMLGTQDRLGFVVPSIRARELWHDEEFTAICSPSPRPGASDEKRIRLGEMFFFLPWGVEPDEEGLLKLHVGTFVGKVEGHPSSYGVLHSPKDHPSTVWPLHWFFGPNGRYHLHRVKRARMRKAGIPPLPLWQHSDFSRLSQR